MINTFNLNDKSDVLLKHIQIKESGKVTL
jgi:hypothetical protein